MQNNGDFMKIDSSINLREMGEEISFILKEMAIRKGNEEWLTDMEKKKAKDEIKEYLEFG